MWKVRAGDLHGFHAPHGICGRNAARERKRVRLKTVSSEIISVDEKALGLAHHAPR